MDLFHLWHQFRPPMVCEQEMISGKLIAGSLRCFLAGLKNDRMREER